MPAAPSLHQEHRRLSIAIAIQFERCKQQISSDIADNGSPSGKAFRAKGEDFRAAYLTLLFATSSHKNFKFVWIYHLRRI